MKTLKLQVYSTKSIYVF